MSVDDLLEYPRGIADINLTGDVDPVFTGPHRVAGIFVRNNDTGFEAAIDFQDAEEDVYFSIFVPKKGDPGWAAYIPLKVYLPRGLDVVLGIASSANITVFYVPNERPA